MTTSELKLPILTAMHALLKPLGYRKKSGLFHRECGDVVHLIEVQESRLKLEPGAKFTINVGIFAPELVYADVREATKPSIPAAHWQMRLGFLSPEKKDLWWSIALPIEAAPVANDVCERIERCAIPALASIPNLAALASVWNSGRAPGLTEFQRKEFLSRLPRAT